MKEIVKTGTDEFGKTSDFLQVKREHYACYVKIHHYYNYHTYNEVKGSNNYYKGWQ